jgi:ADP-heptose:LPS heptosyltransferase
LIAFRHPVLPVTDDQPRWSPHEHDAARWCRLLAAHEIHADPAELSLDVPDIASPVTHGAVIVHPGAGATARRWPADRFVAVVRELLARGERVVVTGDRSEVELADHVTRQASVGESSVGEASVGEATVLPTDRTTTDQLTAGQVTNVAGRTSLLELCALVAGARAMVCNDTGVAHLASAYRVPSVVLFGPTPPAEWGPPPGPHIAIWKGTRGDPYAEAVHPGLAAITVREVIEAFEAVTLIPRGGGHAVRFGNDRLGEDVTTQQRAPERWRRGPPVNPRQEPP